jgi:hypothetical protein
MYPNAPVRPFTGVSQAMHHRVDRRRTRKEVIPRHTCTYNDPIAMCCAVPPAEQNSPNRHSGVWFLFPLPPLSVRFHEISTGSRYLLPRPLSRLQYPEEYGVEMAGVG